MPTKIEEYQKALTAVQQQENSINATLNTVRSFASATSNWKKIVVEGASMPAGVVLSTQAPHFDPKTWPTGQSIGDMLVRWHQLDSEYRKCWDQLSDAERVGLIAPPK